MPVNQKAVFRFGDFEVREREFALLKAGEVTPVEPKAFRVLLILLRNPQKLIAKEELLNAVWGDAAVTENSLTRSIALLRRQLGDDTHNPRYIETVATVGYRFLSPVEVEEDSSAGMGTEAGGPERKNRRGGAPYLWIGGAVVAAALGVAVWWMSRPLPPPRITGYTQLTHDGAAKSVGGTDGSRIYFTFEGAPADPIGEVSVSGGEIAHIPIGLRNITSLEDVSPDGSRFLVSSFEKGDVNPRPKWEVRLPGGSIHRLPDSSSASFAPDGKSIVYSMPDGTFWLVENDGTNPRKLASTVDGATVLVWSPNGDAIRFTQSTEKYIGLWEVSADGSNLHELLPGWQPAAMDRQFGGRWTSDGKFFLFLNINRGLMGHREIWALDERHSLFRRPRKDPIRLTNGPISWGPPFPSKDGKKIFADGTTERGELSRLNSKTGGFEPFLGGISAMYVTYSKDGRYIAYVRYPEGTLWKANRDGSNPVQLTDPPNEVHSPHWSPDGTQIAFSVIYPPDAYIVSADGSGLHRLRPDVKGFQGNPDWNADANPDWSPDGKKIVFTTVSASNPAGETRILDLDSHLVTNLPESVGTHVDGWSPDGRYIAASAHDHLNLKIYDTVTQRWSTYPLKDPAGWAVWSRDSRWIYFLRWKAGSDNGIFRIRVTGGEPELVRSLKDFRFTGWFGAWLGLDDGDSPLMLKDIGSDDIYALTLE
jgi:DNA-binding winged helix-turn-helix (wHTH) protein/Tol biopolymer transport system component